MRSAEVRLGSENKVLRSLVVFLSLRSTCSLEMLTIRFSLTRLETRTKESNIYASIWVVKTLVRNESNLGRNPATGALSTDRVSDFE